ncbi:hypothetical protein AS159_05340 [Thermotoga sp. Ku-13t]|uniref:EAL domain-containing protein n=1 Tax=Thermotoga sp. Ku-13t TaxID=1755813 RepID=UPI0013E9A427|nr:EAL domain-containing protein [Thermotoga sp. Ku-13t]KAF2957827.1 hypothetical protein AS159_05340 [Thermotoga sp. Ku-13t]
MRVPFPEFPFSAKKIIVFVPRSDYLNYLLLKFRDVFKDDVELTYSEDYISFEMAFDEFIDLSISTQEFTEMEMHKLMILPLDQNETFSLKSLKKMRPLQYWIDLRKAEGLKFILENETLVTYFQPIVNCVAGEIVMYECLSRGFDKDGKMISPQPLFELAESLNVFLELNRLAVTKALEKAKIKNVEKPICINFPPEALLDPDFVYREIANHLENLGMKPEQIIFEITEQKTGIEYVESFVIKTLQEKGIKIAIDDAGNGFSSLRRLTELKPDIIKIDMNLIRDVDKNRLKRYMVEALFSAGSKSGAKVIAEGVETIEEYKTLRHLGVELMQGFLFAKPEPDPVQSVHLPL